METSQVVKVFLQAPCDALRPFVKRFLVVEFPTAKKDSHLPDTGLVACFCFKGDGILYENKRAPRLGLTGLWDRARQYEHSQNTGAVLVAFTATGDAALLRQPVDEFFHGTESSPRTGCRSLKPRAPHSGRGEFSGCAHS